MTSGDELKNQTRQSDEISAAEREDAGEESNGNTSESAGHRRRSPVFFLCLAVLVIAVCGILFYQIRLRNAQSTYENLAESAYSGQESEESSGSDGIPADADADESADAASAESADAASVEIPVDFEALKAENSDIYAWIHIDDTVIDYPIVQRADDDSYYLNRQVDGTSGLPGSIYTQASYNGTDFTDNVTIIYGHNMRNDTMFGSLSEYSSSDYRAAHPYIEIYTETHIFTYEIVCAVTFDDRLIPYAFSLDTEEGYAAFLEELSSTRTIPTWISDDFDEITAADRMIVLSTCNGNDTQRYLVGAILVSEE